MSYPNKMMFRGDDETRRLWERTRALIKAASATTCSHKEHTMRPKSGDYLVVVDPPPTAAATRYDRVSQERRADALVEETKALIRHVNLNARPFARFGYPAHYDPSLPAWQQWFAQE